MRPSTAKLWNLKLDKGKDVPVLNQMHRHDDVQGLEVWLHAFLTSA